MSRAAPVAMTPPVGSRRACLGLLLTAGATTVLGGCAAITAPETAATPPTAEPQQAANAVGAGQVKAALILPLTYSGNAAAVAKSMRNAAEMALAEFNSPNVQLLVKDDAGTVQGAQLAGQQALDEGAEIILGPLFAQSVSVVGQLARPRNVPVIAFSTDSNAATRGVYLLSFLPESDVDRIILYAATTGKRSMAALIPDNAYGSVVEAEFKQVAARKGMRVIALEHYPQDTSRLQEPVKAVAQSAGNADVIFIPDGPDSAPAVVQALNASGVNTRRLALLGTGLWADDPRIPAEEALQGALYPAPDDGTGFRNFASRYRAKYNEQPVRTATLAYDAVALVAALVKTQGAQRFSEQVLTNPLGFAGIDGVFRFRSNGTNERGLAVLRVGSAGPQVVSPAPRAFAGSAT
ncbi:MAG: penicillin-binding protein activator [Xanthobacteraceae bacterium]